MRLVDKLRRRPGPEEGRKIEAAERIEVLVLVDLENIMISMVDAGSPRGSVLELLDKKLERISRDVGGLVSMLYAFAPQHITSTRGKELAERQYFIIYCPRAEQKDGETRDTVDETLIRMGEELAERMPFVTHVCICAGDKDYKPFARRLRKTGKRIIFIAGTKESFALDLMELAEEDEKGKRRVYFLEE